ncbi:hypothetical protein [Hungatella effluvii]|uniref:hypothetical protein n=1 Tax=Hungatella effluvii TaxID=1096246 RepID=UPI002A7FB379|nr:hypothetical protein [Hungatella effluvii]
MEKNRRRFGLKMLVMPTIILLLVSFYPLFNSIYLTVFDKGIIINHNKNRANLH